jgi:hypothetical protein
MQIFRHQVSASASARRTPFHLSELGGVDDQVELGDQAAAHLERQHPDQGARGEEQEPVARREPDRAGRCAG